MISNGRIVYPDTFAHPDEYEKKLNKDFFQLLSTSNSENYKNLMRSYAIFKFSKDLEINETAIGNSRTILEIILKKIENLQVTTNKYPTLADYIKACKSMNDTHLTSIFGNHSIRILGNIQLHTGLVDDTIITNSGFNSVKEYLDDLDNRFEQYLKYKKVIYDIELNNEKHNKIV